MPRWICGGCWVAYQQSRTHQSLFVRVYTESIAEKMAIEQKVSHPKRPCNLFTDVMVGVSAVPAAFVTPIVVFENFLHIIGLQNDVLCFPSRRRAAHHGTFRSPAFLLISQRKSQCRQRITLEEGTVLDAYYRERHSRSRTHYEGELRRGPHLKDEERLIKT